MTTPLTRTQLEAKLKAVERQTACNQRSIQHTYDKTKKNEKLFQKNKKSITQVAVDCQQNLETLQRAQQQSQKQNAYMRNNKQMIENIGNDISLFKQQQQHKQKKNEKKMNKLDVKIYKNALYNDRIKIERIRKIATRCGDVHNNYWDWKTGGIFVLECMKDNIECIFYLMNTTLKLSQLFVKWNNIKFVNFYKIINNNNQLQWGYSPNEFQPKILQFEFAESINRTSTFVRLQNKWYQFVFGSNNRNIFLIAFNWDNSIKFWKCYKYDLYNEPNRKYKSPLVVIIDISNCKYGWNCRNENDRWALLSCGKNGYWLNPRNYFKNGNIPPSIVYDKQLQRKIFNVYFGSIQHRDAVL